MSFLLTCDQMGPTLGNGGDWCRSHLCPQLSLYRMMQGIIVGGVTWESCRARVSPSIDTPSCASVRDVFLSVPLGWEDRVWKDISHVPWFPFFICGQSFMLALAMSHGLKHSWRETRVLGTCERNAHIYLEVMVYFMCSSAFVYETTGKIVR